MLARLASLRGQVLLIVKQYIMAAMSAKVDAKAKVLLAKEQERRSSLKVDKLHEVAANTT